MSQINKLLVLTLTATVFSVPAAQAQNSEYENEVLQLLSQQPASTDVVLVPAPRAGLELPKSMQRQQVVPVVAAPVVPAAPQLVNVTPKFAPAQQILAPNQNKVSAERAFQSQFSNTSFAHGVTMESLLSSAYGNNPAINSARLALKAVDEQVYQAYSGYLPRADYRFGRTAQTTTPIGAAAERDYVTGSSSFNVSQGVFGGGETYYAVRSAEARAQAAQSELKNSEQQFLLEAIDSYINYIFTQKVLNLAENNEKVLKEQLAAAQERFVVGDATKTDVAQSEARLANANSNRVLAEGEFVNAKATFKRVFNADAPQNLPMPEKLPDIPADLEGAFKQAIENNPELLQLRHLVESREADISAQASQFFPQVDLTASVANSDTPTAGGKVNTDSESVGFNVVVPIYNGGVTFSRTREARDRRDQVKQQYNDTLNRTRSGVVQAWQRISTTATNIEATKASLVASEFALEGVREEQKEGARTILDVLDAEQERFAAETNHARAIKDSVIAIYSMKSVLGELTPSQLGLSVQEYDPKEHYNNTRFKFIGL